MPTWDRCFIIDGMTTTGIPFPHETIEIDNNMVLVRPKRRPGRCTAHIKIENKKEEDLFDSKENEAAHQRILDFVSIYALMTGHDPTIQNAGASEMRESDQLGKGGGLIIEHKAFCPEEDKEKVMKRESDLLNESIEYFKVNEKLLIANSWLRNALRYFYFAKKNDRLEDKLINMVISLESMFLRKEERGELRYRLSLRMATLIGNAYDDKKAEDVFTDIKELYDKRCDVVHGEVTKVTYDDIHRLKTYTRRAIKTFLLLLPSENKKAILQLLDNCLVGKEPVDKLKRIIQGEESNSTL